MSVAGLLVIAIIFRIGFDVFISRTGGKINDLLANGIFSGLAGVLPFAIYLATKSKNNLPTTKAGVIYSILAGISVAIFSIALVRIFERGGNLSFVTPAIYGGTLIGTSLIGWILFKEPFSLLGLSGVLVIAIGVGMIVAAKA